MENNKEEKYCSITLEQAKNIINSNVDDTVKNMIKSHFNEYELGLCTLEEEFEKTFLDMLDYTKDGKKVVFLNQSKMIVSHPTNNYKILNSESELLFDIKYNNGMYFSISYEKIKLVLKNKFKLNKIIITYLIKTIIEKYDISKVFVIDYI